MTKFAPAFTACWSTAIVAIDVVTIPLVMVDGSPALTRVDRVGLPLDADVLLDALDHFLRR